MPYESIRAAIKTAIEAVSGISGGAGKVTDYEPNVITRENYIDLFSNTAQTRINGWTIDLQRTRTIQQDPGFRFQKIYEFIVRGRYGLQESSTSKKTFADLVDDVEEAIKGKVTIWVEHPEDNSEAIQTEILQETTHGPFLVHECEMRFSVEEFSVIAT